MPVSGRRSQHRDGLAGAGRRQPCSRARPSGRRRRGGVATGEAGVQHRALRLPGGDHRPVLRRPGHRLHLSPHRQLRGQPGRRRGRPAALPRCGRARPDRDRPSSWRSTESLEAFLVRSGVPGITGVDTRRLTRHLRDHGSMPCAFGTAARLRPAGRGGGGTRPPTGRDLVSTVTTPTRCHPGRPGPTGWWPTTSASKRPCCASWASWPPVTVVPATTPAGEVLGLEPDGVFLSNGPGDPAALPGIVAEIRALADAGTVPVFGICLGHQLLATALGATHLQAPLRPPRRQPPGAAARHRTGRDHLAEPQLRGGRATRWPRAEVTHVNLNDGVIEGLAQPGRPGVQRAVPPRGRTRPPRRPLPVRASSGT